MAATVGLAGARGVRPWGWKVATVASVVIAAVPAWMGRTAALRATADGARAVAGSIALQALLLIAVLAVTALLSGSPLP